MKLLSTGETARLLGLPIHKISYAIASKKVPEVKRALGGRRGFGPRDIEKVAKHFGIVLPEAGARKEAT